GQHAHQAGQCEMQRDAVGTTPALLIALPFPQPYLDSHEPQAKQCETRRRERTIKSTKIHFPSPIRDHYGGHGTAPNATMITRNRPAGNDSWLMTEMRTFRRGNQYGAGRSAPGLTC